MGGGKGLRAMEGCVPIYMVKEKNELTQAIYWSHLRVRGAALSVLVQINNDVDNEDTWYNSSLFQNQKNVADVRSKETS